GRVDVDIRRPVRRAGVHLGADPGGRLPLVHGDRVAAGLRGPLLDLPAEEAGVELDGLADVGGAEVHPGRDSVLVAIDLHGRPPWLVASGVSERRSTLDDQPRCGIRAPAGTTPSRPDW